MANGNYKGHCVGMALQEIFRWREHWRNYDKIKSALRSKEMLFSLSAPPYNNNEYKEKLDLFVTRIEALIAREISDTIQMHTAVHATKSTLQ